MTGNGLAAVRVEDRLWLPLKVTNNACALDDDLTRNIETVLKRGYTRFNEFIGSQKGALSICGFAPSLKETWKQITGDVMACNRAHDWLIEQGVIPKWCLLMDPLEVIAEMVTPHKGVTYLVASRCHPKVLEKLEGYKVVVWHCAGDEVLCPLLEQHFAGEPEKLEPMVCGGTATVTRGAVVGVTMGYTDIHVFGADSSFQQTTHLKPSLVPEQEITVMVDQRLFRTTGWMTLQVEDVKIVFNDLRDHLGIRFVFYGDGLIQQVAKTLGYEVKEAGC